MAFARRDDLFSYTLIVPFVCVYLAYTQRATHTWVHSQDWPLALSLGIAAATLWALAPAIPPGGPTESYFQNLIFWRMASWVFTCWTCLALTLGRGVFTAYRFPLLFLTAALPLPIAAESALETALQYGSADTAGVLFWLTGMTYFREGLTFHLPGISLQVAPECSGIHSTLVLFITSLVAAHLFLRSRWHRFWLSAAVFPLGLLRNGFRVWTLGTLCVYDDPKWIHSWLHHRGGPIFFCLSLIPLGLLLWVLVRSERHRAHPRLARAES